ncbi:MAG: SIS domain-containing protein, partial [Micromonosporaceae bacterium]
MTTSENSAAKQDPSLIAAAEAIRHEAAAVAALSDRLDGSFLAVVDEITGATGWSGTTRQGTAAPSPGRSAGRVVVAGLGKSGIIGRKIAATLASTGTPAAFVHAGEALHGDSGMVTPGDVLLVISASGETAEACQFAQLVSHRGITVIALVGRRDSTLGRCA